MSGVDRLTRFEQREMSARLANAMVDAIPLAIALGVHDAVVIHLRNCYDLAVSVYKEPLPKPIKGATMTAQTKSQISLARIQGQFYDAGMTSNEISRRTGVKASDLPAYMQAVKRGPEVTVEPVKAYQLTDGQKEVLKIIGDQGAMTIDVARRRCVSVLAASEMLKLLQFKGIISKNIKGFWVQLIEAPS